MGNFNKKMEEANTESVEVTRVRVAHTVSIKSYTSLTFDATVDVPNYTDMDRDVVIEAVADKIHLAYGRVFWYMMNRYNKLIADKTLQEFANNAIPSAIRMTVIQDPVFMGSVLVAAKAELEEQEKKERFE